MNTQKRQESFSSYSGTGKKQPHPSQQDQFSQYQNKQDFIENITPSEKVSQIPKQKRRYSYGKINQKQKSFNYLNSQYVDSKPNYFTSYLKNTKSTYPSKGINSPCGIGTFGPSAFIQYQQCYLSGLNKYFKSHNYNNQPLPRQNRSISVQNPSIQQQTRPLQRSSYWKGNKFEYLSKTQNIQTSQNKQKQTFQRISKDKRNTSLSQFQRSSTSGLIVNKREIKQSKTLIEEDSLKKNNVNINSKKDTSSYIKIEEDLSSAKNLSQLKKQRKQIELNYDRKSRQALLQIDALPNTSINQLHSHNFVRNTNTSFKSIQNELNFMKITVDSHQLKGQMSSLKQKIHDLQRQNQQICQQNRNFAQIISKKDSQIQRLSKQRIIDNQQYMTKIQRLKTLFQKERQSMVKQFQQEIKIYKCVRNQALNKQLMKQQEQKVNLILQKNKLQANIKKLSSEMKILQVELSTKNNLVSVKDNQILKLANELKEKVKIIQSEKLKQNNKLRQIQIEKNREVQKTKSHVIEQNKQIVIPKWIQSFLRVFEDMIRKLPIEIDQNWNNKKVVIIGWKVIKKVIQKAVKLGIKMPNIINQGQDQSQLQVQQKQKQRQMSFSKQKNKRRVIRC